MLVTFHQRLLHYFDYAASEDYAMWLKIGGPVHASALMPGADNKLANLNNEGKQLFRWKPLLACRPGECDKGETWVTF